MNFQVIWKSYVIGKHYAISHRIATFYGMDLDVGLGVAGSLIMSTVSVPSLLCVFLNIKLTSLT